MQEQQNPAWASNKPLNVGKKEQIALVCHAIDFHEMLALTDTTVF
jgi:hypothetical protein